MRSRNIKPGFFKNDGLWDCDPLARLLFIGLWCLADREGRLEDRPRRIKAEILPADECNVDDLLSQLQDVAKVIVRYEVNKVRVIQVLNFIRHQSPHAKEIDSVLPTQTVDTNGTYEKPSLGSGEHQPKPGETQASNDSGDDEHPLIPSSLIPESLSLDSAAAPKAEGPSAMNSSKQAAAKRIAEAFRTNVTAKHRTDKTAWDAIAAAWDDHPRLVEADFVRSVRNYGDHCRKHGTDFPLSCATFFRGGEWEAFLDGKNDKPASMSREDRLKAAAESNRRQLEALRG